MFKFIGSILQTALPSVLATVLGAYIVNQYINKPTPPTPPAVIVVDPKKAEEILPQVAPAKENIKVNTLGKAGNPDTATATTKTVVGKPTQAVQEKPAPEKPVIEKTIAEKPTARHQPTTREKIMTKAPASPEPAPNAPDAVAAPTPTWPPETHAVTPMPVPNAATVPITMPSSAAPITTSPAPPPLTSAPMTEPPAKTDQPDATDLARAAIERARAADEFTRVPEQAPPVEELTRPTVTNLPEPTRVIPLPPEIVVPPTTTYNHVEPFDRPVVQPQTRARPSKSTAVDGLSRPTPPAEIPEGSSNRPTSRSSVEEDVLSTAKSVFQSVMPQ